MPVKSNISSSLPRNPTGVLFLRSISTAMEGRRWLNKRDKVALRIILQWRIHFKRHHLCFSLSYKYINRYTYRERETNVSCVTRLLWKLHPKQKTVKKQTLIVDQIFSKPVPSKSKIIAKLSVTCWKSKVKMTQYLKSIKHLQLVWEKNRIKQLNEILTHSGKQWRSNWISVNWMRIFTI